MKRNKQWKIAAMAVLVAALSHPAMAGFDVGTKFADVIMEYIQPGKVYNLRTMRNLPYRVENRSDGEIELILQIEIPTKEQLKPGYEAIPDPSWIHLVPNRLKLAKGEEGVADVILQVPATEAYNGRHFQAHITATTPEAAPGENTALSFGLALASRLRFSVASAGPAEIRRLQKQGLYKMLNFTMEPEYQYVPGFIEPGKRTPLKDQGIRVTVTNRSPQKLQFSLKAVPLPSGMGVTAGYEVGDPSWVRLDKPMLTVGGESLKGSDIEIQLPNDPKLRGKRLMFVIQAGLEGREIPVEVFSRLYVNVAQ